MAPLAAFLGAVVALAAFPSASDEGRSGASGAPATASPVSSDALESELERLAKREFALSRALAAAELDLDSARRRFQAAQTRLDAQADPERALRDEVAARRLQLESEQRILSLLEGHIERVRSAERAWRRLHELGARAVEPETLAEWTEQARETAESYRREIAVKRGRLEEVEQELAFTREQREPLRPSDSRDRWWRVQEASLEALARRYEEDVADLERARDLAERLVAALERESRDLPLSARLRAALHQLRAAWNYQLTGSEQEPITPGKIVGAIVIFLIGWGAARIVSSALGSRLFPRMRLDPGAVVAFQSLTFYFLLLVAFVTALRMVQIPLTAFAVVGGALAIGVGFGSQNVVNNFISGIILLAERPIKRGDLIELGGVYGTVERIGLRSTRVRTGDNIHIIVPNAAFLESNVVNWTHTDRRIRTRIAVGIVYGSPTREAERLIYEALRAQPEVLQSPEPVVLFQEFGDNALVFDVRFWIEMRTVIERLRIESDIRFRIDDLFREAGIVIAFPQRDVHLDAAAPIEVRLLGDGALGDARKEGSPRED